MVSDSLSEADTPLEVQKPWLWLFGPRASRLRGPVQEGLLVLESICAYATSLIVEVSAHFERSYCSPCSGALCCSAAPGTLRMLGSEKRSRPEFPRGLRKAEDDMSLSQTKWCRSTACSGVAETHGSSSWPD